ncbi:MAG: hypothetical protein O6940_11595 [Ignavibacteria bacterium]|nr:hypothetical protein [Ignavibacteria bacterium]
MGNSIASLVNEEKPAGEYEITFNVINNTTLASGIYCYQLTAITGVESYPDTKKCC